MLNKIRECYRNCIMLLQRIIKFQRIIKDIYILYMTYINM